MHADALDTLVGELQKNGYFEHKKMSEETRKEFEKIETNLESIKGTINKKVPWKSYIAISIGVLGYITTLMGIIWSEIKDTNNNVKLFDSTVFELKLDSYKINQRLDAVEKQQSLITNILNKK